MRLLFYVLLSVLMFGASCSSEQVENNVFIPGEKSGVLLVTAEDGHWVTSNISGRKAVTLKEGTTPKSSFLYFQLSPEMKKFAGSDFYIIADIYTDGLKIVNVSYNTDSSPYTNAPTILLFGNKEWKRSYTHITDANLKGAQNAGADFRLSNVEGLAVSRLEIVKEKPNINVKPINEIISEYMKGNPMETDMFYTYGNDADESSAILYKTLGVTSIESYVTWETCESKGEGQWDWSRWDKQVKILKDAGLKWVPFLILSPAYSTPDWFRASKEHVPCRCLEHGIDSKIESLWNPYLPARIERFIAEFAKRYRDADVIESVLLGIQGDFGEAIYSVFGGGWTFNIPGEYHNHMGYWCGDPYALKAFRNDMQKKYKDISLLNKAWGTKYASFDVIEMPGRGDELQSFVNSLQKGDPGNRRRWIDFIDWYRKSMTDLSDWWMKITRKYFPDTPIYLCTGGDSKPELGSNFAEQCRVSAKHNAGVRITNEASNYANNFMVTRWVASAGKHYGAYFGFEPAGTEDAKGIVARIYNATASGANQLHDYSPNVVGSANTIDVLKNHFKYLFHVPKPIVPVAVWYPNVSLTLKWGGYLEKTAKLRDYTDVDFVDESMLRTGALKHNKILVIVHGNVMEPSDANKIASWIIRGGRAIVMDVPKFESVEGDNKPEITLFANQSKGRKLGKGSIIRVSGWDNLASELRKTLDELNLPVYDLEEDGIYGTQINDNELLFLNTKKTKNITIKRGDASINAEILGETITRVNLK